MSTRLALLSCALVLGACSTVQENPNYRFSSKYGEATTTGPVVSHVQTASHPVQTGTQPQIQTRIQPAPLSPPSHQSVATYPGQTVIVADSVASPTNAASPTEQAYDPDEMPGTPGYGAYIPEDAPVAAAIGPRAVEYDYSENVRGGVAASIPAPTPMVVGHYTVQPGDTVYSMARRLCVPLSEIMSANGIGADYAIAIGQTLSLPAPRC
ncbi:MAG: LysM domain-containing protein [Litorimonas sp.]